MGKHETALRQAIKQKIVERVAESIKNGANVNCVWTNGYIENETPLMLASDSGSAEIVNLLIKSGADVTLKTSSISGGAGDLTALHYALNPGRKEAGYFNIVKVLLKAGSDPDSPSNNGNMPLANAAQSGWKEAVVLLLDSGAKSHLRSGVKFPPLHGAILGGNIDVVSLLIERGAPVDCRGERGDTALMIALKNGKEDAVEFLLQHGADPKAVNDLNQTTLICAALFARDAENEEHKKAIQLIGLLLDQDVAINAKDKDGKTAYDHIQAAYEPEAVNFLKQKGAKLGKQVK